MTTLRIRPRRSLFAKYFTVLFTAVQAYVASTPAGSEEQEQAKAMLAEMQANGMVQEGAAEVERLGQKHGVDPFAQPAPKEKPMAQGVRAGLMAQGAPR